MLEFATQILPLSFWPFAIGVALFAGLVKGVVGFGMPLVLISGLSLVMPPDVALGALILPTVASNILQAFRQGIPAAVQSISKFRRFLIVGGIFLLASSQLTPWVSAPALLGGVGILVVAFCILQLSGRSIPVQKSPRRAEVTMGAIAGFIGGMTGVWGPPTVALLTAMETEKREQMRIQGVIYGLGAVALVVGHTLSGIFNLVTAQLSAVLLMPAVIGVWLGSRIQDRIDQATFRKVTLIILLIAGANLIRRAVVG